MKILHVLLVHPDLIQPVNYATSLNAHNATLMGIIFKTGHVIYVIL
jgi:hypothetical protein